MTTCGVGHGVCLSSSSVLVCGIKIHYDFPTLYQAISLFHPNHTHTQWLFPKYLPHGLRFRGSAQWPEGPLRSEGIVLANASSFVKRTLINAIFCLDGQLDLV